VTQPPNKFLQAIEERKRAQEAAQPEPEPTFDADLIPELDYDKSEEEKQLDAAINSLDILTAYQMWCGKMQPKVRPGQKENIMVSCPRPDHPDKHPSAWINLQLQAGNCAIHGGFDAKTIVAWNLGLTTRGTDFIKVRQAIGERLGFRFVPRLGGGSDVILPHSEPKQSSEKNRNRDKPDNSDKRDKPAPALPEAKKVTDTEVVELYPSDNIILPSLEIDQILPKSDTFLDVYCGQTRGDEAPDEFHLFHGMVAIGMACGRQAALVSKWPVYGNLFICTVATSGSGKSQSKRHLTKLLKKALPYDYANPLNLGVKQITPSSAEKLVDTFSAPIRDPGNATLIGYAPVKGVVHFDELASLLIKSQRVGNPLRQYLMEFFDMADEIRTQSMATDKVAENPFGSCITSTQPEALEDILSSQDNSAGFLNRWLYICGTTTNQTMFGSKIVDIDPAVPYLEKILGWAASFRDGELITYEPDAKEAMVKFVENQVYADMKDDIIFKRLDLMVQKMVLLLAANEMRKKVTLDIVERVKLLYAYILRCYTLASKEVSTVLENKLAEKVKHQIQRLDKGQGVALGAIIAAMKGTKTAARSEIYKTLDLMVKLGEIEEMPPPAVAGRGRPTKRYRYVA
jgi:hypothetical protein